MTKPSQPARNAPIYAHAAPNNWNDAFNNEGPFLGVQVPVLSEAQVLVRLLGSHSKSQDSQRSKRSQMNSRSFVRV